MNHDKGKNARTRVDRGFKESFRDNLATNGAVAFDNLFSKTSDVSPEQSSGFENTGNPDTEESTQRFAQDIYARAAILTNNANTRRQIEQAISGTELAFAKDLSQIIDKFDQLNLAGPVTSCFEGLHGEGLDIISNLAHVSSSTLEDADKSNASFVDLIKPAELRKVFVLTDDVRASILLGAKTVAETLILSQCFRSNLADLGSTPPPRVLGLRPDEPAIAAGAKIMAATYSAIWALFEKAVCRSDDVGAAGKYRNLAGLSAFVIRNLSHQLAFCIAAELANDASVKPHLPRVLQVIKSIKFSSNINRHQTIMKASPKGDIFLSLIAACKAKGPLEGALDLLINTGDLAEISNSIQDIPEDQLLDSSDNEGTPRDYGSRMQLMWSASADHKRIISVKAPLKGKDADAMVSCSGQRDEDYLFFISDQGELNYTSLSSRISLTNLTSVELDLLSHYHPNLKRLGDTATRAVRHARYILKQAEDLCPDLMCRVEELPRSLAIIGEDDAISFLIKGEELGAFLDLFKHKEAQYDRMAKSCGYDPEKDISVHRGQVYTFRVRVEQQEQEATSKSEVTLITQDQANLRREVKRLLRDHIHNFGQLFGILDSKLGVTLDETQGKGDHKMLCRGGHRFTLAPKYRDPSARLNIPISMRLIESLDIPLADIKKVLEEIKP
jgi:hypothetical protein